MASQTADESERAVQAGSFGGAAVAYERGRPPYPAEAVDWLLRDTGHRVLDLGAGTGKLTRQLAARGLDAIAVEPSRGMREQLAAVVANARVLAGAAESIPLPPAAVDAVLVAQAWHWVDTRRAVPEAARVLAPGGVLGLVWNVRDERDPWTAQLGRLMHPNEAPATHGVGVAALAERPDLFGPVEVVTVEWRHELTGDELIDLVSSRSYVITMPDDERAALLAAVSELAAARHPVLADQDQGLITIPYVTHCYRARRLKQG
jgi:SAM-dependent methyltransferase